MRTKSPIPATAPSTVTVTPEAPAQQSQIVTETTGTGATSLTITTVTGIAVAVTGNPIVAKVLENTQKLMELLQNELDRMSSEEENDDLDLASDMKEGDRTLEG
ncbi:hypothetical protein B0H65DRAFT_549183 [Neurospora tetraspora]|uniref:Uncharacterized protein n=1 Tax=Neurospora tetraspora TaxID=94610 RepID=A0AAE0MSB5_9PEZI|nr:hypothetical protein B0H65DRAFT_549183 [Neurospora tetraspora]